jgi:hypothetical protein
VLVGSINHKAPDGTSSFIRPNIFLSSLFWITLCLLSFLNVRDWFSQPHKTTGKIIFLYTGDFVVFLNNILTCL